MTARPDALDGSPVSRGAWAAFCGGTALATTPGMPPSRSRALAGRGFRGRLAESLAVAWLRLQGCEILARRRRIAGVEVDVLARQGSLVLVVEVKSRSGAHVIAVEDLVSAAQLRRLERAGEAASHRHGLPARVDLVEIRWRGWRWPCLRWHRGPWEP